MIMFSRRVAMPRSAHIQPVNEKVIRMREQLEVGQMLFVADGGVGVGAVREVTATELVVNIQNAGDFVLPFSAVRDIHSGKVMLDLEQLDAPLIEALKHVHDAEDPLFAVIDPNDGTPDDDRVAH